MLDAAMGDYTLMHRQQMRGVTLDDHLWFYSLVAARSSEMRQGGGLPYDDCIMWSLLRMGYNDPDPVDDKPHWDSSVRAMRYAAILGDRFQREIERMRARVSTFLHET